MHQPISHQLNGIEHALLLGIGLHQTHRVNSPYHHQEATDQEHRDQRCQHRREETGATGAVFRDIEGILR